MHACPFLGLDCRCFITALALEFVAPHKVSSDSLVVALALFIMVDQVPVVSANLVRTCIPFPFRADRGIQCGGSAGRPLLFGDRGLVLIAQIGFVNKQSRVD